MAAQPSGFARPALRPKTKAAGNWTFARPRRSLWLVDPWSTPHRDT